MYVLHAKEKKSKQEHDEGAKRIKTEKQHKRLSRDFVCALDMRLFTIFFSRIALRCPHKIHTKIQQRWGSLLQWRHAEDRSHSAVDEKKAALRARKKHL